MAPYGLPCKAMRAGASQSNMRAACPAANPANPRPLPCRCVGLGASGRLYVGVNLEFPCLPLHNSVHAEQFLVVNALQHGERELVKLAVSAAPCGHCRQFLSELCCAVRGAADFSCVVPAPQQPVHSCVMHAPKHPVAISAICMRCMPAVRCSRHSAAAHCRGYRLTRQRNALSMQQHVKLSLMLPSSARCCGKKLLALAFPSLFRAVQLSYDSWGQN